MKINPKFVAREVMGETIVVNQGSGGADLTKIISLNETATWLWKRFAGVDFNADEVAQALVDEYAIDGDLAIRDANSWIESLKNCGVIER